MLLSPGPHHTGRQARPILQQWHVGGGQGRALQHLCHPQGEQVLTAHFCHPQGEQARMERWALVNGVCTLQLGD